MDCQTDISIENQEKFNAFINREEPPCDYERQLWNQHKDRISAVLEGKIIPPYDVEIQPSSVCNLDCAHCFGKSLTCKKIPNKMGKKEMGIIAQRINDFKENGFKIEIAKFCGTTGEPLVNPACLFGISLFKVLGKKVVLFTNGLLLDKKIGEKEYLDYVLNVDRLNVSLDAGSSETFKKIKGVDGFERIINSLERLINKKEQENRQLNLDISYVIGKNNYHEIEKATRLAKELGADEIIFRVDFTNPEEIQKVSHEIIPRIRRAKEYHDDKFKVISIYSEKEITKDEGIFLAHERKCFNHHFWACVGPDCQLYACGHRTYHEVEPYGDLIKNSFRDIWTSEKRISALRNLPDDHCKFCSPSSTRRNDFMTFLDEESKNGKKML